MANTDNKTNSKNTTKFSFAFERINYILMGIGIVVLLLGYILLSGGGSDDPNVFNSAMFDNRRLVVAPILITLGLLIEIVAILFKSNKKKEDTDTL